MNMIKYPNIQVTKGLSGWFAVMLWWNPDGFAEPYETGEGRYALQADAIAEAKEWAEGAGLPFYPPKHDPNPARQDVATQIQELIPGIEMKKLG
jgi:hypothetical protein